MNRLHVRVVPPELMPYKDKEKQREYQRKWMAARRAEYTDGQVCVHCGEPATDWHHRDPKEKKTHRIWSWKRERIEDELAKCEPVCEKCHNEIHNPIQVTHGDYGMYNTHGCRCDLCKEAMRSYRQELRQKKAKSNK